MITSILIALIWASFVHAFYLPGVTPSSYNSGDAVPVFVNHITPTVPYDSKDAKRYLYSYDYYNDRFHFCTPKGGKAKQRESLGSIIFGDRIYNSPITMKLLENSTCNVMCTSEVPAKDAAFFAKNIRAGFQYNWMVDGLPVAKRMGDLKTKTEYYSSGFPMGYVDEDGLAHPYNSFSMFVEYHHRDDGKYRVVGVTVVPESLHYESETSPKCDSPELDPVNFKTEGSTRITYTYSVFWVPSDTVWATRWDKYLHVYDPKIQWFSLVNFGVIVLILSAVLSNILFHQLKNDIKRYQTLNIDDSVDDMGWKLVSGDVFRPPRYSLVLSVLLGSGTQLLLMTLVSCAFALFGLLSPSNRGSLSTVMFVLYALFGFFGSFVSGYVYKFFNGQDWKLNMALTPILVPGLIFLVFFLLNLSLVFVHSSGAVPAGTMLAIVVIWFTVSIPLSCLGSICALKAKRITVPCKVNEIPRQIPRQPWYMRLPFLALAAGIFPFGAIAIEMFFVYRSLWFSRIYYMFGFLFFCFVLMLLTTLLVTLLVTYFILCNENYKWQWESLVVGGGISAYIFAHALVLSRFRLQDFASVFLYVGYSGLLSVGVGLICGTVGFLGSLGFVLLIYSQVKMD